MKFTTGKVFKVAVAGLMIAALSGCGLPRSGPSKQQLLAGSQDRKGDALVVVIDSDVIAKTKYTKKLAFGPAFKNTGSINTDVIRSGDQLLLTVTKTYKLVF